MPLILSEIINNVTQTYTGKHSNLTETKNVELIRARANKPIKTTKIMGLFLC